jgi:acetoacetate decarboxylase
MSDSRAVTDTPPRAPRPDGGVDPKAPFRGLVRLFLRSFSSRHPQCLDARFVSVEVPVDRQSAQRLLPPWLRLARSARATLFIVEYRQPTFTSPYREAAVMLHVRTLFGRGVHCCWMVLDPDDSALIYGRELLAFPKKMARIHWEEDENGVRASVMRHGQEIIALEARKGAPAPAPAPLLDVKTFNIGGIGQLLAVNAIWCFRIRERFRSAATAEIAVTIRPSRDDPVPIAAGGEPLRATGTFGCIDIYGLRYLFPAGFAGPWWFARTYFLRFR